VEYTCHSGAIFVENFDRTFPHALTFRPGFAAGPDSYFQENLCLLISPYKMYELG
jgi:hypothetical protein